MMTDKELDEALDLFDRMKIPTSTGFKFGGFNVCFNEYIEDVMKLPLSSDLDVSQEFRDRYNKWSKEMFGTVAVAFFIPVAHTFYMNERYRNDMRTVMKTLIPLMSAAQSK